MRFEFAEQYNCVCIRLDGSEIWTADALISVCHEYEATYDDGEDICFIVQFPGRPQELYTEEALRRSFKGAAQQRETEGNHRENFN